MSAASFSELRAKRDLNAYFASANVSGMVNNFHGFSLRQVVIAYLVPASNAVSSNNIEFLSLNGSSTTVDNAGSRNVEVENVFYVPFFV